MKAGSKRDRRLRLIGRTASCLCFALLALCIPPEEPGGPDSDWRRIYSADGADVFILKEPGRAHLLAYIGFRPAALSELDHARTAVSKNGYNLLTFTLTKAAPPAESEAEAPAPAQTAPTPDPRQLATREFVDFAGQLTGYGKRILVVPGAVLPAILPAILPRARDWSGLVILRPGDAPIRDKSFLETINRLPASMEIFWLSSGRQPERGRARLLATKLKDLKPRQFVDTSLPRASDQNFYLNVPPGSDLDNFLLLHHLPVTWGEAEENFAGGCSLRPDGRRPIRLQAYQVSAATDRDVCPLFLRHDEKIFRAGNVAPEGCTYPLASRGRTLYCKNQ